ncbi:MAG: hypothetical protein JSR86_08285 [Proteobacteria bacterium]|nr:hypothetical protein [Pseudomonadota bacterium]
MPQVAASGRPVGLGCLPSQAWLAMMLTSGGDERLWIDPATGRNRYGCPPGPADDEIWLASSTASAVSRQGWRAAGAAMAGLWETGPMALMEDVRRRLLGLYGAPGADCVLSASGTEAELIVLALARSQMRGPLTNLVVAPAETGSGVPAAADGRHFLASTSLGGAPTPGARLAGLEAADIAVRTVDIRGPQGEARPSAAVDLEAEAAARAALADGRSVLLHVLDCSKTGLAGVSRAAARAIADLDPARVLVVVDACQLRCGAAQVRADLADGFAVMITGSKFAGGPAFCGALLLPAAWMERLAGGVDLPAGLSDYSARLDWPRALRARIGGRLAWPANVGLGLRWSAALAEIEAYEALEPSLKRTIVARFEPAVRRRVSATSGLRLLFAPGEGDTSIAPILVGGAAEAARGAWTRVSQPGPGGELAARCHLGQPVAVGQQSALRLCASMPMVSAVAARLAEGDDLDRAMAPLAADIDRALTRLELAVNETA